MSTAASTPANSSPALGTASTLPDAASSSASGGFDVVAAYKLAAQQDPHPIAAIRALTELMAASTATTISGLMLELRKGRQALMDTQTSLGVRAGCQLWERFISAEHGGSDFVMYKKRLLEQGRDFCNKESVTFRRKITDVAVDFLRDDAVILIHSYSRTVVDSIIKAHKQHKRISVYVTEARPRCLGLRTYQKLTEMGIPCTVVLDSAVGYVMERVDMVLLGCEAVVESGALVSSVGTSQVALIAKALQKPVFALAESYKFLRYYPLQQTDLPMPSALEDKLPLSFPTDLPSTASFPPTTPAHSRRPSLDRPQIMSGAATPNLTADLQMSRDMIANQPPYDITYPDLIDFIITDLGSPLSPTSVSQYLVAQFSQ